MITLFFRRIWLAIYQRRWLLSRRAVQLVVVLAFVVKLIEDEPVAIGNLSSSIWFGWLTLTDPFVMLQSMLANANMLSIGFASSALIGALIVGGFYAFFGGRIYCSWVCPINLLTDAAFWLRQRLKIKQNITFSRELRVAILVLSLLLSALWGTLAWEAVNPITLFQRELMWTSGAGVIFLAALFLFDLFVTRRGWCGHLCPVGGFYAFIGRFGRVRVTADQSKSCSGCSACIRACPEPHVLAPLIAQEALSVTHGDCTRCGACLDQCDDGALAMKLSLSRETKFRGIPIIKK